MVNGLELEAGIQMANATEARARGTRRCTLRDHATDMAMSTPSTAFAHSHGGLIEESELSFFWTLSLEVWGPSDFPRIAESDSCLRPKEGIALQNGLGELHAEHSGGPASTASSRSPIYYSCEDSQISRV